MNRRSLRVRTFVLAVGILGALRESLPHARRRRQWIGSSVDPEDVARRLTRVPTVGAVEHAGHARRT